MTAPTLALQTREALRSARLRTGLSQPKFAARLGVNVTTVSRIECGRIALTLEMIERWAGACGVEARIVLAPSGS